MIKASAGGGGKGMRVCYDSEDFVHTFETAKLEAENAFGEGIPCRNTDREEFIRSIFRRITGKK